MQVSSSDSNMVMMSNGKVTVNGHEVKCPNPFLGQSMTQVDGKLYVNGKKYNKKSKSFEWSLMALIHYIF